MGVGGGALEDDEEEAAGAKAGAGGVAGARATEAAAALAAEAEAGRTSACTALLGDFHIPAILARDVVSYYGPSLFVQQGGTKCGLHVDAGASHFWQFLWQGRKTWRVFKATDFPRFFDELSWQRSFFRDARCTGVFGAAASSAAGCELEGFGGQPFDGFDDAVLDSLGGIEYYETELQPGELIFVPAHSPHQIRNMDAVNVAVSMNFVDSSNVADMRQQLLEAPAYHHRLR